MSSFIGPLLNCLCGLESIDEGIILFKGRNVSKLRPDQIAGTMSGGEQRMLEIGRSLMLEPQMLMMDEPSAGLAPNLTQMIFKKLQDLNQEIGLTVLMIEQNARQGLKASHRGYVLELGQISYQGSAQELLNNLDIRRDFLGV